MKNFFKKKKRNLIFLYVSIFLFFCISKINFVYEKKYSKQVINKPEAENICDESIIINDITYKYIVFTFNKGLEEKLFYYYKIEIIDKDLRAVKKTFKLFSDFYSESNISQFTTLNCNNLKENNEYTIRVSIKDFSNKDEKVVIEKDVKTKRKNY